MTRTTTEQLYSDISDISVRLVQAFGLAYGVPSAAKDDLALARWMDYRLRHVTPQVRTVLKSSRFPVAGLPPEIEQALSLIEARFANGEDVNPYLSKTTINNDVSDAKSQRRTDGLWADWRIHHFHLTTEPIAVGERFSKRSGWLLFAMVYEDVVAFIDIRSHNESDLWTQDDLLKTFIDSWPEQAEPHRITTMTVESRPQTPQDLRMLRQAGVIVPIEHDGKHYFGPGGGVTCAATSVAVSRACLNIRTYVRRIAMWLDDPNNKLRLELRSRGFEQPRFAFGASEKGLLIGELSCTDGVWELRRKSKQGEESDDAFSAVNDLFLPEWAALALSAYLQANQSD